MSSKINHLLLTTLEDPFNPNSWSGTPYYLRCALEKRVPKVTVLSGLKPKRTPVNVLLRVLLGGNPPRYPLWMTRSALRGFSSELRTAIERVKPDAVLSISSQCLIELKPQNLPVYMFTDAPWLAWKQSYGCFESMPIRGRRFAQREGSASEHWDGVVFGSDWAVECAKQLYSIDQKKIYKIPLGANCIPEVTRETIFQRITKRQDGSLKLLYVGKDWERKGGPLAVAVARVLYQRGVNVRLHIVGCHPTLSGDAPFVKVHGLLRQDNAVERTQLRDLFLDSHFLIVPTLAECFGVAFAEAQAFGLPPVSRAVHALPSVVLDGKTGILMSSTATAENYADRILDISNNGPAYQNMARSARNYYETTLDWNVWADRIVSLMETRQQPAAVKG